MSDDKYHIKPSKERRQRNSCFNEEEHSRIHDYYWKTITVNPESAPRAQVLLVVCIVGK